MPTPEKFDGRPGARDDAQMEIHAAQPQIAWGPCCFCGKEIVPTDKDPCRVTVETAKGRWQVWFCHAACFRERVIDSVEVDLSPVHL
jgi:hypothetical protein